MDRIFGRFMVGNFGSICSFFDTKQGCWLEFFNKKTKRSLNWQKSALFPTCPHWVFLVDDWNKPAGCRCHFDAPPRPPPAPSSPFPTTPRTRTGYRRHPDETRLYGCFLPDLTRFTAHPCTGPVHARGVGSHYSGVLGRVPIGVLGRKCWVLRRGEIRNPKIRNPKREGWRGGRETLALHFFAEGVAGWRLSGGRDRPATFYLLLCFAESFMAGSVVGGKRVLILSASAGARGMCGRRRQLMKDFLPCIRRWPMGARCSIGIFLKYTSAVFRHIYSKVYLDLIGKAPWLLGMVYKGTDKPWKEGGGAGV